MRSLVTRVLAAYLLAASVFVLASCQLGGNSMLTSNDTLDKGLVSIIDSKDEPVPLTSLTDFEWDEFGFATEGTTADDIKRVFGERIIKDNRYSSSTNLFVFKKDGAVIHAIMVSVDYFDADEALTLYSDEVTIGFRETTARPDLLHFVDE